MRGLEGQAQVIRLCLVLYPLSLLIRSIYSSKKLSFEILYYLGLACMCVCTAVFTAQRSQKKTSDPLGLKLKAGMSCPRTAGTEPGVSGRVASALN